MKRNADFSDKDAMELAIQDQYSVYQALKPAFSDLNSVKIVSVIGRTVNGTTTTTQTTATLRRIIQAYAATDSPQSAASASSSNEASDSAIALVVIAALILVAMVSGMIYFKAKEHANSKFQSVQLNDTMGPLGTNNRKFSVANLRGGAGNYSRSKNRSGLFRSEANPTANDFLVARLPQNIAKNRSQEHIPYDVNRVKLKEGA